MTSNQDLLADRYGRRVGASKSKNRAWIFSFAALALAAFTFWAITAINAPTNSVAVVSSGSKQVSSLSFSVQGKVSRPAGGVVRCALRVQALNFAVVGYREIELAAGVTTFDELVYSTEPGVNASVQRCWVQ